MLKTSTKKHLVDVLPTTYTVDGIPCSVSVTFGDNHSHPFKENAVNISLPVDGVQHYRSMDDFANINNNIVYNTDYRRSVLRFKVTAIDSIINVTEEIEFVSGTLLYKLKNVPVSKINSIGSFVYGTDYRLINRDTIEWLAVNTPADGEIFTVDYDFASNGYWMASGLVDEVKKTVSANLKRWLTDDHVIVDNVGRTEDISITYLDDTISAFVFDVRVVYPWTWTREMTDEDGTLIDRLDVTVQDNNTFTID